MIEIPWDKFPLVDGHEHAHRWLQFYANIGRAPNTIIAYGRAVDDIAHNLTRAAATLAGRPHHTARAATIRRHLINVAARITRHARQVTLHLPQHWPWQHNWLRLFTTAHAPPA